MVWLLLIVAAVAAAMGWMTRDSTSLASTLILPIEPPAGIDPFPLTSMALSSDGTSLAFIGVDSTRVTKLFVQSLDGGGAEALLDRPEELEDVEDLKAIRYEQTRPLTEVLAELGLNGSL